MTARKGDIQYTPELGDQIAELIIKPMTIKAICALDDMPSVPTFFKWLRVHPQFANLYARAKEEQADVLADEILQIADNTHRGTKTEEGVTAKGVPFAKTITADMIEHRRLQVDARKFIAAKMKPKKYGDSVTLKGDAENPISQPDVTESDRKVLQHFIKHYADRAALTKEQIDNGEDLV